MYQVGDMIGGYRVLEILGRGGMGEVYRAAHPRLPRSDALKVLRSTHAGDPVFRARFEREADLVAPLNHPNIVAVFDRGVVDGRLWIAMEYVPGADAGHLLEQRGVLDPRLAVAIVTGVANALDTAHRRGITHRDIKPANILITPGDDPLLPAAVKLTDFGIAQALDEVTALTGTGATVGTLRYSSPEQIEGNRVDARSDTYSLGATAYELLTGAPPFDAPSLHGLMTAHLMTDPPRATDRNAGLPAAVDAVLTRSIAKDPERRYQSASALADALAGAFDSRATLIGPVPGPSGGAVPAAGSGDAMSAARGSGEVAAPVHPPAGPPTIVPPSRSARPARPVIAGAGKSSAAVPGSSPVAGAEESAPTSATRPRARGTALGVSVVVLAAAAGLGAGLLQSSASTLSTPDRPDAEVTTRAVELTWNPVEGATGYVVMQNDEAIYTGTATSYAAPLPVPGRYSYRVAARGDSARGSDFSLTSDEVTVFMSWGVLQPVADLYPDLVPASPLSTNGFDGLRCWGEVGDLVFESSQQVINCSKYVDEELTERSYWVAIYAYDTAEEAQASAAVATNRLDGEPVRTAQGAEATRYLSEKNPTAGEAIVTFGSGDRARTYLQVTVPGASAAQAGALLDRLPI